MSDVLDGPAGRGAVTAIKRWWVRDGPVKNRLQALLILVLLTAAWAFIGPAFATVSSFYKGTGVLYGDPQEKQAVARVEECREIGPLSTNGFGYWWECRIAVRVEDGRFVRTLVSGSVVTPEDTGLAIVLREACFGENNTDCRYGRPVHRVWAAAVSGLGIIEWTLTLSYFVLAGVHLLHILVGASRTDALLERFAGRRRALYHPRSAAPCDMKIAG